MELPRTPSFRLDGRRALVAGASSGIGLGCAAALAEAGAHVVMAARGRERLRDAVAAVKAAGRSAEALTLDITDGPATRRALEAGAACDSFEPPYLNACGYDAAGEILRAIHAGADGGIEPRGPAAGALTTVDVPGAAGASLLDTAYLYVPEACANGERCGLHVFFHGCQMSSKLLDDAVIRGAGFNEWADSNRLLVLYPQVRGSRLAPMNPMGCFDWWGYTDSGYATRDGAQIRAVKAVMDSLAGGSL